METKNVEITDEFIKLDQFLKFIGVAQSGGDSKVLIKSEDVKVNGEIELRRGKKLRKGDEIEISGISELFVIK